MTKLELKKQMEEKEIAIHKEIKDLYPNAAGLDGIISMKDYLDIENPDSKPLRILWILKERGFPDNIKNQDDKTFYVNEYMKYIAQYNRWRTTYGPMCSVTEGILEFDFTKDDKFLNYNSLYKLEVEDPKGAGAVYYKRDDEKTSIYPIDHIAFLNVKKLGSSEKTSNPRVINAEYEKPDVKRIIKEQFDYIDADIIIMGCHVKKLAEDLAGVPITNYTHVGDYGVHDYYFDSNRKKLFIYADHPSRRGKKEIYCNSIFTVIKNFSKELLK